MFKDVIRVALVNDEFITKIFAQFKPRMQLNLGFT